MDHPIIRLARLKYIEGSIEQGIDIGVINHRLRLEGLKSEEDYLGGELAGGQGGGDERGGATELLSEEPETCAAMFEASHEMALEAVRQLFRTEVGPRPEEVDHLDATAALLRWARRRRGFDYSSYRAQLWEFVVEIVDAALWLGWLFPQQANASQPIETSQRS